MKLKISSLGFFSPEISHLHSKYTTTVYALSASFAVLGEPSRIEADVHLLLKEWCHLSQLLAR
jgi:hypothetical protein